MGTEQFSNIFFDSFKEGMKIGAHILWDSLVIMLKQHWLLALSIFFVIVLIATLKAMAGRWGTLGSVIYNSLYFGTILTIGLIKGPEIFLEDFFNLFTAIILYPVCYFVTGLILNYSGLRRRYTWK